MSGLDDRVGLSRETDGDDWLHRFANGLLVRTEPLLKADTLRILPIGGPQSALMNHLLHFPERARGRRVFEPFAGSGAIGLMAIKAGARHVDLLDLNPRAAAFQLRNADASGIAADAITTITADAAEWAPTEPYDLVLANPPFVPTPPGLQGSLTSDGGPEGNDLAELVLRKLDGWLAPAGEALIVLMQLVRDDEPLVLARADAVVPDRPVHATPTQQRLLPFDLYVDAYHRVFADERSAIDAWEKELRARHGSTLAVSHYVVHVLPEGPGESAVTEDFAEKYGAAFWTPTDDLSELAVARVLENLVPEPAT